MMDERETKQGARVKVLPTAFQFNWLREIGDATARPYKKSKENARPPHKTAARFVSESVRQTV